MRKFVAALFLTALVSVANFAQTSVKPVSLTFEPAEEKEYYARVFAGFTTVGSVSVYSKGAHASFEPDFVEYGRFKVGASFAASRDYLPFGVSQQYVAGPNVRYALAGGRVEPFARYRIGATKVGDFRLTQTVGGGVDLNFGQWFVRPVGVDGEFVNKYGARRVRVFFGGGFRF